MTILLGDALTVLRTLPSESVDCVVTSPPYWALIEPMLEAGCPVRGVVLDCFFGAGTTGVVAKKQDKDYIGIELNPAYVALAQKRIDNTPVQMTML